MLVNLWNSQTPIVPLTVRILSYKYERYIPQCLQSFAMQSVRPQSFVISDDCSPAPHAQAFYDLAPAFPWARFRDPATNLGVVAHVRHLLADLDAPFYCLFSADDYLVDRDFLRDAVAYLQEHPKVVVVYAQHASVDDAGNILAVPKSHRSAWTEFPAQKIRDILAFDNVIPAVCCVVRASAHERVPIFPIENRLCHDWLQWYLLTFAGDFARMNRVVTHYRVHPQNLSSSVARDLESQDWTDRAYTALLAHSDPSPHDRKLLRAGRIRKRIFHTRTRHLWQPMWQHAPWPIAWRSLAETLAERVQSRVQKLRLPRKHS